MTRRTIDPSMSETTFIDGFVGVAWLIAYAACAGVVIVGLIWTRTAEWSAERHRPIAYADAPRCARTTSARLAALKITPRRRMSYEGFGYAWYFGDAACKSTYMPKGLKFERTRVVCQFSNPLGLEVTTPGGVLSYQTRFGDGATVTVKDGKIYCAADADIAARKGTAGYRL